MDIKIALYWEILEKKEDFDEGCRKYMNYLLFFEIIFL
jgi:hypothetical protein